MSIAKRYSIGVRSDSYKSLAEDDPADDYVFRTPRGQQDNARNTTVRRTSDILNEIAKKKSEAKLQIQVELSLPSTDTAILSTHITEPLPLLQIQQAF